MAWKHESEWRTNRRRAMLMVLWTSDLGARVDGAHPCHADALAGLGMALAPLSSPGRRRVKRVERTRCRRPRRVAWSHERARVQNRVRRRARRPARRPAQAAPPHRQRPMRHRPAMRTPARCSPVRRRRLPLRRGSRSRCRRRREAAHPTW